MKRYYISKIIGDGTEFNAFRPKVAEYGVPWAGIIATGVDGKPLLPWAFCIVGGDKHIDLLADADNDGLPDFPLDAKVSAMHKPTKDTMLGKLQARNIDTSFISTVDGYRDIIRKLGQLQEPTFNENGLDVADK